jgi:hypothetical protein
MFSRICKLIISVIDLFLLIIWILIGYTVDVIQDASAYAEHAGKNDIDEDDVKLAIQGRITHSFTAPPRQEV